MLKFTDREVYCGETSWRVVFDGVHVGDLTRGRPEVLTARGYVRDKVALDVYSFVSATSSALCPLAGMSAPEARRFLCAQLRNDPCEALELARIARDRIREQGRSRGALGNKNMRAALIEAEAHVRKLVRANCKASMRKLEESEISV